MSESSQYCTFYLDDLRFGIDVQLVQEVLVHQHLTPVPLSAPVIRGLINLRGQIITAVDLRECLGLPTAPESMRPRNVVIDTHQGTLSFLVDRMGDVLQVSDDLFEPAPDTLPAPLSELIEGAYKLEEQLLLPLDLDQVVDRIVRLQETV